MSKYLFNNGVVAKFFQLSPPHYIEYNPTHRPQSQGENPVFSRVLVKFCEEKRSAIAALEPLGSRVRSTQAIVGFEGVSGEN